jgi:hypothetical protein
MPASSCSPDRKAPRWRTALRGLCALLAAEVWLGLVVFVAPQNVFAVENDLEAKVKSAYLYHLIRFVEWPRLAAPNTLRLCVVGAPEMSTLLNELSNSTVQGQAQELTLRVETTDIGDPSRCQILFIGRSEARSSEWLARVRGKSILTVSDRESFASQGGMVGFYRDSRKLKLEINPDVARSANLRVSSKLLEIARTVASDH